MFSHKILTLFHKLQNLVTSSLLAPVSGMKNLLMAPNISYSADSRLVCNSQYLLELTSFTSLALWSVSDAIASFN